MGTKGIMGSQIASQGCLSSQADVRRFAFVNNLLVLFYDS